MTALCNQRGTALVAALGLSMILLPLGALVVLQCRTDLSIQHNLRSDIETFYVAEAGLAHAAADILPGQSLARVLAGPDGIAGTSDDGTFPFVGGPPPYFPNAPFHYDVRAVPNGSNTVRIVSSGTGRNGSVKVLETLLARAPAPFTPAALYAETNTTNVDLGSAGFRLSGFDHQPVFPPVPETNPAAAVPALSTSRADAEALLRTTLPGTQVSGAGGPPSVGTTQRLDIAGVATSMATAPASTRPTLTGGDMQLGTRAAPQLALVTGDLAVTGRLTGSGVLVIQGALHVSGTVEFSGLVVALGAVVFEPTSMVTIAGGLWQAASQDERLDLRGRGAVVYSSDALAGADRAFPGLLPHAVAVVGWQEQL